MDVLEQMDMMDLTDQDTVDVFLGCGTEESSSSGPGTGSRSALRCSTGAVPAPSIPPAAHSSALAVLLCQSPIPALSVPVYTHTPCTKTAPWCLANCEAGQTSPWADPCLYPLPQPRGTEPINVFHCRRPENSDTSQSLRGKFSCPEAPPEQPASCHDFLGPHHAAELAALSGEAVGALPSPASSHTPAAELC